MKIDTKNVFPFTTPPKSVLEGTYEIKDESLVLETAFHQTSSATLVLPRDDGKFLIPAVALNESHPAFDLTFMAREGLAITRNGCRRWAVWCGRTTIANDWKSSRAFTPKRLDQYRQTIAEIQKLYAKLQRGKDVPGTQLRTLFSQMVSGFWLNYYSKDLPEMVRTDPNKTESIVQSLFDGFEETVIYTSRMYEKLDEERKLLLHEAFNFTVEIETKRPVYYVHDRIDPLISGDWDYPEDGYRNPLEIVGDPRGIDVDKVLTVYLPNEIIGTPVETVAMRQLNVMGIPADRIMRTTGMADKVESYDHCLMRYGKFTGKDLRQCIENDQLTPVFK